MNTAIQLLGYGGAIPAVISLVLFWLVPRLLPPAAAGRYAAALSFALAFFVSFALCFSADGLVPSRHWHWLPYLAVAASVIGPMAQANGVNALERWLLYLLLAIMAAWLLTPAWPNLQPTRPWLIATLAGYLFSLMAMLDALPDRLLGTLFPRLLCAIAAASAILVAAMTSLKLGQIGGIAGAATLGFCILPSSEAQPTATRGWLPAFAVTVGGLAFVATIEPDPPNFSFLAVPAVILFLWAFAREPLARLTGSADTAARCAFVLVPLAVLGGWILLAQEF